MIRTTWTIPHHQEARRGKKHGNILHSTCWKDSLRFRKKTTYFHDLLTTKTERELTWSSEAGSENTEAAKLQFALGWERGSWGKHACQLSCVRVLHIVQFIVPPNKTADSSIWPQTQRGRRRQTWMQRSLRNMSWDNQTRKQTSKRPRDEKRKLQYGEKLGTTRLKYKEMMVMTLADRMYSFQVQEWCWWLIGGGSFQARAAETVSAKERGKERQKGIEKKERERTVRSWERHSLTSW